ncbi:MAG TPA: hypothetical protein VHM23_13960 [Actinomycetota bacterium]|jgi:hypothetical protein|nr:hypothetical protein [Actinomycetota bacterium]
MARPRQTATISTPARTPRKPAGRAKGSRPASGRQARKGREAASKATTAKPNLFDDIARQVNADQEAKDRAAGRDDLTPTVAKSVDGARAKPSRTSRAAVKPVRSARPAKPTRPTKVQASGSGVSFSGRPTTKVETVAARVKKAGLRIRADADVDAIAARLRATPAAVSAWLATRNRAPTKPQAKVTAKRPAKVKPRPVKPEKAPTITLGQVWDDKKPDWLYRCTLVTRYEVRPDGTVWSTLDQVLGPDGQVVEDFWRLPLDYRPTQQVTGNGRKLVLKDRTIVGLQTWLIRAGLTTPEDGTT